MKIENRRGLGIESLERRELLAGDGVDAAEPSLRLMVRDDYLPGVPVLVRAQLETADGMVDRAAWDETIVLSSPTADVTISAEPLEIVNGMGSTLVTIQGGAGSHLASRMGRATRHQGLDASHRSPRTNAVRTDSSRTRHLSGVVRITDDLVVPSGRHLEIEPGTLVLLDGTPSSSTNFGAEIRVEGSMRAAGTADDPITFTAADP